MDNNYHPITTVVLGIEIFEVLLECFSIFVIQTLQTTPSKLLENVVFKGVFFENLDESGEVVRLYKLELIINHLHFADHRVHVENWLGKVVSRHI